jgi:alginate O-acetyltransferase complex protein AlgJ
LREEGDEIDQVVVGRDGWLFLRRDTNDVIGQHLGRVVFSRQDRDRLERLLVRRLELVERAKTTWLLAVVPDKEAVYADALPAAITPSQRRPVHDLLEIADQVAAPVVYLLEDLLSARKQGEVYARVDTHWNYRGAYVGYRAVCENLRRRGVDVDILEEGAVRWFDETIEGDLGSKLGLTPATSPFMRVEVHPLRGWPSYDNQIRNRGRVKIFEQASPDGPTCVVFGESFAESMLIFLCESFTRLVFVHSSMLIPEIVEIERPDVVLNLPTERFLIQVPTDDDAFRRFVRQVREKGRDLSWPPDAIERTKPERPSRGWRRRRNRDEGSGAAEGVELAVPNERLLGHVKRAGLVDGKLQIMGWAIGRSSPVARIEILMEGNLAATTTTGLDRPDLAAAFPDHPAARTAGYRIAVEARGGESSCLEIQATLEDGRSAPLGRLRVESPQRRWWNILRWPRG